MKKNKRHLYKRLPKYALGTMKPIDLGYQPGRGIGSARFETELNISLEPETQAIRKSALPNALGYIAQLTPYITESLKAWGGTGNALQAGARAARPAGSSISPMAVLPAANTPASTVAPINIPGSTTSTAASSTGSSVGSAARNIYNTLPLVTRNSISSIASNVGSTAVSTTSSTVGVGSQFAKDAISALGAGSGGVSSALSGLGSSAGSAGTLIGKLTVELLFEHGAGAGASAAASAGSSAASGAAGAGSGGASGGAAGGSAALGAAGKVMAGVGAALGAYTMANQIAGFGDHRSAPDMLANVGRSHVTTDYGNLYTTYNGVNAGQELAYEKANARSKQLGFGMNALGTGASIGSLILPGWGTAIGAAAGLLLGGLGSLFGWGDNSEEIERLTRLTNDNIAMYNRQGESVARSKDVAAEFNNRQGVATAAEGKNAFGPMTSKKGDNINTPRFVFDINKPNNIGVDIPSSKLMPGETVLNKETSNWAVVPGKGDKDNVYSTVKPGDPNVVYTKKGGISKKAQTVLKSNAPENLKRWQLNELEKEQSALLMAENNQTEMKKYKNGKLPGFWRGTDYLMSAIPHIAALGSSWNLYNRAKYADMPDYPTIVDSDANTKAINILGSRRYNVDPILDNIHKNYRQYLYNISHSGASAGQQSIERANAFIKKNEAQTQALTQADEINNRYTADYANALANYGKWMSDMMTNNNYARAAFKQQQNAAKEGWMAQYEKNGLTALADLASDIMGVRQFNRSEDYGDKMLKLYNQLVENDKVKVQAELANAMKARLDREAAYNKTAKEAVEKTHPMFLNQGIFRPDGLWNVYGSFNTPTLSVPGILRNPKYMKYAPAGYKVGMDQFLKMFG